MNGQVYRSSIGGMFSAKRTAEERGAADVSVKNEYDAKEEIAVSTSRREGRRRMEEERSGQVGLITI